MSPLPLTAQLFSKNIPKGTICRPAAKGIPECSRGISNPWIPVLEKYEDK